jgi:phage FluMu gp28-like protein
MTNPAKPEAPLQQEKAPKKTTLAKSFNLNVPCSLEDISNPDTKLSFLVEATTPVKLLSFQKEFFQAIQLAKTVCIVASRQVGKTFGLAALAYAHAVANPNSLVVIISTGENHAVEILDRVRWCFHNSKLEFEFEKDSRLEIKLRTNGSRIISRPSNPKTLRGYSANLVIIDEVAAIDDWDEMRGAIFPMVSNTGGTIVLSSTFKGKNHFWDIAMDSDWNTRVYPWWVNPSEIIEHFRKTLPYAQFMEEFECVPVDEFHSLFPFELIEELTIDECEEYTH